MTCLRGGLLCLWLIAGITACAMRPPAPEPSAPSLPAIPSATVLATIVQRWQSVEDLRALIRVTLTSPQGRYSTKQTLLWRRPASLRLDTISLFGQPVMTLVADLAGASIYYPQQGKFFQGPASASTLARVIGLPLDVAEVAPLLVGSLHSSVTDRVEMIHEQVDAGMYLLRLLDGRGQLQQDLWVDPERLLPQRTIRYTNNGLSAVDITYNDYQLLGDVPLPFELRIWVPRLESEVRLQFLSIDLNPGLPSTVFQLSPPAGVQVAPLP